MFGLPPPPEKAKAPKNLKEACMDWFIDSKKQFS